MSAPVILVDGSSYLFRAFYALPNLTNSKGEPTGAILGVLNMLRRLLKEYSPTHIAVIFDTKSPNFRHQLYTEYKANREKMPNELASQIAPLHSLIRDLGIPLLALEGIEADDVIASLTHHLVTQHQTVLISTGDKDMTQLIQPGVTLVNTMKNELMDRQFVIDKFGVPPEKIIDYLCLVGDTSDNIPGIPKVGPKTAAKWLSEYGDLSGIVAQASTISGAVGESLRQHLAQLPLTRTLVTLRTDLELPLSLPTLTLQPPNKENLIAQLERFEIHSWLKELRETPVSSETLTPQNPEETTTRRHYTCITTVEVFNQWKARLAGAQKFALDTETTDLDPLNARLMGLSISLSPHEAAYIPVGHHYLGVPEQLPKNFVLEQLKPILENPQIGKIGQNIRYDLAVLKNEGIQVQGIIFDTLLAAYVLSPGERRYSLFELAREYLQVTPVTYEELTGKGAAQIPFSQVDLAKATDYSAEDADLTLQLSDILSAKLAQTPSLQNLFKTEELPLLSVLERVERRGVLLDSKKLYEQSTSLSQAILIAEQKAHQVAGQSFNLASPKQLLEILYYKLQLPILKKTPKGQPSTAEEVLEELALSYELPRIILEHRHLSKLKSTYTDKLPLLVNPKTGRVHTHYQQALTSTGRLSSTEPNLQNIPIRSEEGRKIRQAFIAPPSHVLLAADYSQIELRIMAHLSEDARLLKAFAEGQDIHKATAAEIFNLSLNEVTSEQRRRAKAINFGLIYGMSGFGLSQQLGIGRKEADAYLQVYFERYPQVLTYMNLIRTQAEELGYVETLFGRRLYFPQARSKNGRERSAAQRAAINAPMQGTAADIIKRAMIAVDQWIRESELPIHMILQVHDELVFEVPQSLIDLAQTKIRSIMCEAAKLKAPLEVDIGIGQNWDEAH